MNSHEELGGDEISRLRLLPWIVGIAALVVYLLTLNHWVTLASLGPVARLSGLSWQPDLYNPVYWLITYPFRWLPVRHVPLALNLFSAVCAALTLCFLARSVILLPHDRTHEQRQREQSPFATLSIRSAWLPPVLAVLICGLELSFWEHATVASAEIFDLMVFAYIIRCLLEYRIGEQQHWLTQVAFLYGASMSNNWAMIGFFPLLIVVLVWIKGLSFFNSRFLGKMVLCGFAGLLFYLVLPLANSSSNVALGFWPALKANLAAQRGVLSQLLDKNILFRGERPLWVLALPSLAPLLLLGISWPSYFGDPSKLGVAIATWVFHFTHGFLLLFCVWVALDPALSPRHFAPGLPMLPAYYLATLSIGYFCGYFLLVFGAKPFRRGPPEAALTSFVNSLGKASVWVVAIVAPLLLILQNLPRIKTTNGDQLWKFATLAEEQLPAGNTIVLSDYDSRLKFSRRQLLLELALLRTDRRSEPMFVCTGDLQWPEYHRFLKRRFGARWPSDPPPRRRGRFDDSLLVALVKELARTNMVYYSHPSFGYYFEYFYLVPHGLVYRLADYHTNDLLVPLPDKAIVAENDSFWAGAGDSAMKPISSQLAHASSSAEEGFFQKCREALHLLIQTNSDSAVLGGFYSRALDFWGVELQRSGLLAEAGTNFSRALELNPENMAAEVNRDYNQNLQLGRRTADPLFQSVEESWVKRGTWDDILGEDGPFDEPRFCTEQAKVYLRSGLYRQALQQFDRVRSLDSTNLASRIALAQLYVLVSRPDDALALLHEITNHKAEFGINATNQTDLVVAEMSACLAKGELQNAQACVTAAVAQSPRNEILLSSAAQIFLKYYAFSNAAMILDQWLDLSPTNTHALLNKGYVLMQFKRFNEAIPVFGEVLARQPNHQPARYNRAIACLQAGQLEEARQDYEILLKDFSKASQLYYGLGEIAYRQKDTNAAIRNYQLYLTNSPPSPEEARVVAERLKELKAGSR